MRWLWRPATVGAVLAMSAASAHGQGYRLRIDTRVQSVAFRGVTLDSVPVTDVVVGEDGGFETVDGFATRCPSGRSMCTFFRPGAERQGGPVVGTVDLSVWGLGVPGLSFRGSARLGADLGDVDAWPGTDPAVQLLEGHAEYASRIGTVQLGRVHAISRFGFVGFDGAKGQLRLLDHRLRVSAYGGWGLARGVALPVSSPALDPLDDFQPSRRQLTAGGEAAWSSGPVDARVIYQRQVDRSTEKFVSERAGFEAVVTTPVGLSVAGGADYDLSAQWWGSAEAALRYAAPQNMGSVAVGARRYRPHFDLWTIWGAFSPVPYRAVYGTALVRPVRGVDVQARVEAYEFDETEAAVPLVVAENAGWRWSVNGRYRRSDRWSARAGMHAEFGAGAASVGYEGGVSVQPTARLSVSGYVSRLERPLEFRFNEARVWSYRGDLSYAPTRELRLTLDVSRYDENRDRPDAGQLDWNQLRVAFGATLYLGSAPSNRSLPPAILRIPMRGGAR